MKVTGIIAEYNPMHNGHIYHLERSKVINKADFIVVVMSGDFVQRGEPAILDKWTRSRLAIEAGADLVLELPHVYACNSSRYFAKGAMDILKGIGCVDSFSFGAECREIESLTAISNLISKEDERYKEELRKALNDGHSYARAVGIAVGACLGEEAANICQQPNNILAIEYLKNRGEMTPTLIKREGPYHDNFGSSKGFMSAETIRGDIKLSIEEEDFSLANIEDHIPVNVFNELKKAAEKDNLPCEDTLYKMICAKTLTSSCDRINQILGVVEGLENRIVKEIRRASSFDELIKEIKTKRYTYTAISRMFIHILSELKKKNFEIISSDKPKNNFSSNVSTYARILAMNGRGGKLLNTIKKDELATIPIITNINKVEDSLKENFVLKQDIIASDLYNLCCGKDLYENSDYVKAPYIEM